MSLLDRIGRGIEKVSRLPKEIDNQADRLNDKLIKYARDVQDLVERTSTNVEQNLRTTKVNQSASQAANWIQKPKNLILVGGSALAVIVLIFTLRKG